MRPVNGRDAGLLRGLLLVLSVDAAATSALVGAAHRARGRPSGPAFSSVAGVAVASLLPGAVAVVRERRAHARQPIGRHRLRGTVVLLFAGLVVNTVGTLLVLRSTASVAVKGTAARRADLLLLVGGDLIGVPYLALVMALHTDEAD